MTAMVSVLMSVYHKEDPEYLARSLESVIDQSEPPEEIVLVEDGPLTAELDEVVRRYETICGEETRHGHGDEAGRLPQLRVVKLASNQGLGPALAAGMKACRGNLIARMDTDDIAAADRIRLQKAYMCEHPEISAVGGDICEFMREDDLRKVLPDADAKCAHDGVVHDAGKRADQDDGNRIIIDQAAGEQNRGISVDENQIKSKITGDGEIRAGRAMRGKAEDADSSSYRGLRIKHMPTGPQQLYRYGRFRNPLNHMTVMFRKADIEAVGGYHRRPLLEDYDLWSRLMARGYRMDNIPEVLVYARLGEGFSNRRGGFSYFKEYAGLRWMQLRIGYLHGWEYLAAMAATAGMTLVPADLRGKLYEILRRG